MADELFDDEAFYDWSDDWDDAELAAWPNCAVPDCENKACTWADVLGRCAPCAERVVGADELQRRYDVTHPGGFWNGEIFGRAAHPGATP